MKVSYFAILLLAGTCAAQQAKPAVKSVPSSAPPPATQAIVAPQLSSTEKIALTALFEKSQTNQQEARSLQQAFGEVNLDFMKEHPGWHLDGNGNPQKDAPAK